MSTFKKQYVENSKEENPEQASQTRSDLAVSTLNVQISVLTGEEYGLKEDVADAEAALVKTRVSIGRANKSTYVQSLLIAQNLVSSKKQLLEDCQDKIKFLKTELALHTDDEKIATPSL